MKPVSEKFIVVTEFGNVAATINPAADNGLESDLLLLSEASAQDLEEAAFQTPLRAFAVKMVDLIMAAGFEGVNVPATMRDMLVRERATEELGRIERWARDNLAAAD